MIHVDSEAAILCALKCKKKYSNLFSFADGVCKVREWPVCVPNKPLANVWIYDQLHPQAQTSTREIYDEQCFGKLHHFIGNVGLSPGLALAESELRLAEHSEEVGRGGSKGSRKGTWIAIWWWPSQQAWAVLGLGFEDRSTCDLNPEQRQEMMAQALLHHDCQVERICSNARSGSFARVRDSCPQNMFIKYSVRAFNWKVRMPN